jgi:hypothetical protein
MTPFVVSHETMHRVAGAVVRFTPRFCGLTARLGDDYPTQVGRLLYAENRLALELTAERDGLDCAPCPLALVWRYRCRPATDLEAYRAVDCYLAQIDPDWRRMCHAAATLADLQPLIGRAVIAGIAGWDALPWDNWSAPLAADRVIQLAHL